ncbi:MAG TPA: putative PEP-binding protein [Planctomycetota bacterium]|nr:putative PEP-binding protein [Planctomycetota bacterium]
MTRTADTHLGQSVFSGQSASPGVACGPAFLSFAGLGEIEEHRLTDEEVEQELGRLDSVARAARVSLVRQRESLADHFTPEQRAVFDTHLHLLEDPVIEADVKDRIREQRMTLENSVKDVFHVYERLFEVVQTESLRNKMSDMRDVALRILRHCSRGASSGQTAANRSNLKDGILVVKELSLSDLTEALEHGIAAIAAESGSTTNHGAILTRAAGIPAVIGVKGLRENLTEGQTLLVDGNTGQVVLDPSPESVGAAQNRALEEDTPTLSQPRLADGTHIHLCAAVASATEARTAARIGIVDTGIYRTELPIFQRQGAPKENSLAALYKQVLNASDSTIFRLPDLDSSSDLPSVFPEGETNPALGLRGIRLLFSRPEMLNLQLRAIYRASEGSEVRVAVPFVTGPADLRRTREAFDTVREELRLAGVDVSAPPQIGAVIETPSSALLAREVFAESDFITIGLDSLSQYVLCADRNHPHPEVLRGLTGIHRVVLRAVRKLCQLAGALGKPLSVYGETVLDEDNLELLVGSGVRSFALRPALLQLAQARLDGLDLSACERSAEKACH